MSPVKKVDRDINKAQQLGLRLKEERLKHQNSQQQTAELGRVGLSSQKAYEAGARSPNADYLQNVADAGYDVINVLLDAERNRSAELDVDKLSEILRTIDEWCELREVSLPAETRAELASLFYKQFSGEPPVDKEHMRGILKLVK